MENGSGSGRIVKPNTMTDQDRKIDKLNSRLNSIELRIARLESALSIAENDNPRRFEVQEQTFDQISGSATLNDEDKGLESQIGRFGLAWLGNIVLLFGIVFMTQYLMNLGHRFSSVFIGYAAASGIWLLANYIKKTNVHLAFIFDLNSQILLFYSTIRLHFFSASPLIPDKTISVILLIILVAFQTYLSIRNKSQAFAALSVLFTLVLAIIGDSTHFMLPVVTLAAGGTVYYFYRFEWKPLLFFTILFTYFSFFLWLFGNPFAGHPMQMISEHHFGVIYYYSGKRMDPLMIS
jgi:hypothetical protein